MNAVNTSTSNKFALARTEALKKATPEQRERVEKAIREFAANSEGISDQDLRTAIQLTLAASGERSGIVIAVYDASFVYVDWWTGQYSEVDYEKDDKGNVTFDLETAVQVRPMTEYVPITVDEGTNANNEGGNMANNANANTQNNNASTNAQAQPIQPLKNLSYKEALEAMTPEARSQAAEGEKLRVRELDALCNAILKAQGNKFSREDLSTFSHDQLERIAGLIPAPVNNSAPANAAQPNANANANANNNAQPNANANGAGNATETAKFCTGCGHANANGAKFCGECGTAMVKPVASDRRTDFRGNNANASTSDNGNVDGSRSNLRNQAAPGGGQGDGNNDENEVKPINLSERIKQNRAGGGRK